MIGIPGGSFFSLLLLRSQIAYLDIRRAPLLSAIIPWKKVIGLLFGRGYGK